ncbi:uridine phosphorylase [Caldisphaera lagunensis DSM 15908]|uniref:Uridine phosphorylase n=1 Tax=Caldisphaera lagunensis (strain DSM 15908 / JCM 11604 / ANMR 0165 / IC-154) TaxID=1056495 RepID=L0A9I9_CALLD|nr:purine-nucleoside phosphorylase [Caldisphaera lagunensis]AFZ70563.1 uridine phosphorylase [Caldisphaera lagunensis DSM 15908]
MKKVYHLDADEVPNRVIIMGDPQRVINLSLLLENPVEISKSRNLFIYKGYYNNKEVALASHGIGGPSAAIVIEELIKLGANVLIRLGTVGSLKKEIDVGDVIIPTGASYWHGGAGLGMYFNNICPPTNPSYDLVYDLIKEINNNQIRYHVGSIFSSDSFYAEKDYIDILIKLNFIGIEMECATLFAISNLRGVKSACSLVTSNNLIKGTKGDYNDVVKRIAKIILNVITSN